MVQALGAVSPSILTLVFVRPHVTDDGGRRGEEEEEEEEAEAETET